MIERYVCFSLYTAAATAVGFCVTSLGFLSFTAGSAKNPTVNLWDLCLFGGEETEELIVTLLLLVIESNKLPIE